MGMHLERAHGTPLSSILIKVIAFIISCEIGSCMLLAIIVAIWTFPYGVIFFTVPIANDVRFPAYGADMR
jgi:hypothetical protein